MEIKDKNSIADRWDIKQCYVLDLIGIMSYGPEFDTEPDFDTGLFIDVNEYKALKRDYPVEYTFETLLDDNYLLVQLGVEVNMEELVQGYKLKCICQGVFCPKFAQDVPLSSDIYTHADLEYIYYKVFEKLQETVLKYTELMPLGSFQLQPKDIEQDVNESVIDIMTSDWWRRK